MIREELKQMSDKEKIQLLEELKNNSNEINKVEVIRSLFTDELKSSCIHYLSQDDSKSAITYSMTEEENKYKVISSLTDEKAITSATIEGITLKEYKQILAVSKEDHLKTESHTHTIENTINLE